MTEVELYIYDLSGGMASQMSLPLLGRQIDGIWHTSLVAFGVEIFYGHGISMVRPGMSHFGQPLRKLSMGQTHIDSETFYEYIDQQRATFSAERYHLLRFNCNTFTNDVVGFLTGGTIPREIRELPSEFLSTPFGQSLLPTIDSMFGAAVNAAPALPANVPASNIAASVRSGTAPRGHHPNGINGVSAAVGGQGSRTLASHLSFCTNVASFQTILSENKAVVAMFTSETCPPCRAIKPVFEGVASDTKKGAFVLVDTLSGRSLAAARAIGATPTFQFFLDGQMVHEMKGADARELRSQIDLLLHQAYPPHPHAKLALPRLRAIGHQTVTYTSRPNFAALLAKLKTLRPASGSTLTSYETRVVPFLQSEAAQAHPPDFVEAWLAAHRDVLATVPIADWFPALDLVRLALVDPRFATSQLSGFVSTTCSALSGSPPRSTALTGLRMLTNAYTVRPPAVDHVEIVPVLVTSLLADDKDVRTCAAGLAFVVTRWSRGEHVDDEWTAEVASALAEALAREEAGEVIHRLTAALGLLFLESAHSESLCGLFEALDITRTLNDKVALVTGNEAIGLMQEVVQLCDPAL